MLLEIFVCIPVDWVANVQINGPTYSLQSGNWLIMFVTTLPLQFFFPTKEMWCTLLGSFLGCVPVCWVVNVQINGPKLFYYHFIYSCFPFYECLLCESVFITIFFPKKRNVMQCKCTRKDLKRNRVVGKLCRTCSCLLVLNVRE